MAEQPADDAASPSSTASIARLPWLRRRFVMVGLGAALIVVLAAGVGAFALLNAGNGPSPIEAYVPLGVTAFAEVRFDAPGDQKLALAQLLLRTPGLSRPPDTSAETARGIASLLGAATHPVDGFAVDVRPWLGGAIGAAVFLPVDGGTPRLLAMIGVRDVAAAGVWADDYLVAAGGPAVTEPVRGGTLRHGPDGSAIGVVDGAALGGGTGSVLLAGADADVRAALDAATSGAGLASTDAFRSARSALPGDELARAFVDAAAARSWLAAGGSGRLGWLAGQGATADAVIAGLPAWAAIRVRAEGDALLVGAATAGSSQAGGASGDAIAGHLPPDTVAVLDLHDAGAFVAGWLEALRKTGASTQIDRVDGVLAGIGGIKSVLAQIGAADVLATWDGSRIALGLVVRSTDQAATRRLLDSLRSLAAIAQAPFADQMHGDTTITTALAPDTVDLPLIGRPAIEVAMRGDLLIVGVGSGFAAAVLDAGPGHALADQPAYQRALARAGGNGTASCYTDVQAARTIADRLGIGGASASSPAPSAPAAGSPVTPATPLDALGAVGCIVRGGGSVTTITLALTVR